MKKKDIGSLVKQLHKAQKKGAKTVRLTHFDPSSANDLTEDEKAMDSMARILGGTSIGAVCYDENKFLVARNDDGKQYEGDKEEEGWIQGYFNCFQTIAEGNERPKLKAIEGLKKMVFKDIAKNWTGKEAQEGETFRIDDAIQKLENFSQNLEEEGVKWTPVSNHFF